MAVGRFEWEKAIRDLSDLPASARLVGYALATYMDSETGECYPAIDTLRDATRLGRSTVIRRLNTLDEQGWLHRRRGGGTDHNGKGISTRYAALIPPKIHAKIKEQASTNEHDNSPTTGPPTVPHTTTTVPPEATNSPTTGTRTTKNNQEQAAAMTQTEIQEDHPDIWAQAIRTTAKRTDVRSPDQFALKIARDLIAQSREVAKQMAVDRRQLERIEQCTGCASNGFVETDDGWVRCLHPLL